MNKALINGYDLVEKCLGYFPAFHDAYITGISIEANQIDIMVKPEAWQSSMHSDRNKFLKLTFKNPKKFNLKGEICGVVSIIYDLSITKNGEELETVIETSLGAEGTIFSEEIEIALF